MNVQEVIVRFAREGTPDDVELDPTRTYLVSINGGPRSVFRSPWTQIVLEERIASLRNTSEDKPDMKALKQIGRELGEAVYRIHGLPALLQAGTTVYWQLDYPELARIPWELTTTDQPPYRHLLLQDIAFVRCVPAAIPDRPVEWPTGRNEKLRLLFAWSEGAGNEVPHEIHLKSLERICKDYDVYFTAAEVSDLQALQHLCSSERFHFCHLLAHGARTKNGEWGLRFRSEIASGERIARTLIAGGTSPALVTVSACDSANEMNNSFSSVAYYLHVYGIPLVLASQFRLRKNLSSTSTARVYEELLGGGDVFGIVSRLRQQLAPADNEAWANEVLYSRYRQEVLEGFSVVARQQAALRRARSIAKNSSENIEAAIGALENESKKLLELVMKLENRRPRDREALAETYGLLGSLRRRIAERRADPPDQEELRSSLAYYEKGFRADANSHFCGINVVHLCLRLGEQEKADEFIPRVRYAAENDARQEDNFWAYASAGDLEVYAGRAKEAAECYREFVRAVEKQPSDKDAKHDIFQSSYGPLQQILKQFSETDFPRLHQAAKVVLVVLDSAISRHSESSGKNQ
ncbi:MAG: CHAT domain-containing protein [Nitrospirales bacterium]|nr:CHAT domain-containing protein [Nitrospirales bacterium]